MKNGRGLTTLTKLVSVTSEVIMQVYRVELTYPGGELRVRFVFAMTLDGAYEEVAQKYPTCRMIGGRAILRIA